VGVKLDKCVSAFSTDGRLYVSLVIVKAAWLAPLRSATLTIPALNMFSFGRRKTYV
jgi:hypothetical protein